VWTYFFGGHPRPHVATLKAMIRNDKDLCLRGMILANILQGICSSAVVEYPDFHQ